MFQEEGTMKSLHWRCEMWFDCVERKRRAKLPASATAPALVHGQVCTLHRCVFTPTYTSANTLAAGCVHMCICIYVCICMRMHMDAYVRV